MPKGFLIAARCHALLLQRVAQSVLKRIHSSYLLQRWSRTLTTRDQDRCPPLRKLSSSPRLLLPFPREKATSYSVCIWFRFL